MKKKPSLAKPMVKKKEKTSSVWLIIFLCAVIVCLVWLVSYGKRLGETNLLNQEINRLNQELEEMEISKQKQIEKLKDKTSSPSSSIVPSATPSVQLKPETSTISAEKE